MAEPGAVYAPRRPPRSRYVALRGLEHHILTWGEPQAPTLFMLHGWMDAGASFQFLIDALKRDWFVVAPDLRGFGRSAWQPQGYWFADYVADLEALIDTFARGERVNLVGHSLGANVVMIYAGVRPARVRRVVALDGFGIPAESAAVAPSKFEKWLDAMKEPLGFAPFASFEAVADRLCRNNRRLPRDKARFLAQWWAKSHDDGSVRLAADPRHKLPFPIVYRQEEVFATWQRIEAPALWVAAEDSHVPRWLDSHPEGEAGTDGLGGVRRRLEQVPGARLVTIPDAGHMLQHDQPERVARAIEPFLES